MDNCILLDGVVTLLLNASVTPTSNGASFSVKLIRMSKGSFYSLRMANKENRSGGRGVKERHYVDSALMLLMSFSRLWMGEGHTKICLYIQLSRGTYYLNRFCFPSF